MPPHCLVYGGSGQLGRTIISHFKKHNWAISSIDFSSANSEADHNITVKADVSFEDCANLIVKSVHQIIANGNKFDVIINVAGGWVGGNAADKDFIKNTEISYKQSIQTSTIAAHLASLFLKENGLLVLTGSHGALSGTPGAIGYGLCKAAVHQLVKSLACLDGGLPNGSKCVAILPSVLDTPMNRKYMSEADFTNWTPMPFVANMLYEYSADHSKLKNGALLSLLTRNNETSIQQS